MSITQPKTFSEFLDALLLCAQGQVLEVLSEQTQPKQPIVGYLHDPKTLLCDYPEVSFVPILNATT